MNEDINQALAVLRSGGVILYPTDTIWGLGCDATLPEAVQRIYELKKRIDNKSMIILVDHPGRITSYVESVPEIAFDVIEVADKPLTVIFEGAKNLAANVINQEDNSIAIRVVKDAFCQQLIQRFKKPIVSTSANISGEPYPASFHQISTELIQGVDYVVTHRKDELGLSTPSSIVKIGSNGSVKIIR